MRRFVFALIVMLIAIPAVAIEPPAHTYSIVARDAETGELGVAVQSHWFSVGSDVTWAEAGVGAIATQSFINPAYGPRGLELMKSTATARSPPIPAPNASKPPATTSAMATASRPT
jgi:hypothetical protein